ncbi:MAG: putative ABC exporter domain-containing protein [Algoriphagus sp.]|uniref:putative ABC exporter domain-containing protein n=1 Tax=Algoriphagus sp. TaxID=1872435 RepID=UPI00262D2E99|nr:putative ABC exporter domain-containing protein [Algoriphagus sp.]MDG1278417.1 putative ABC exporter domain-containing protein [Algoriphagus sp.]
MREIKLLLRKDLLILLNNIKLILKNPLRLLPYVAIVGYFSFMYWLRLGKGEDSVQQMPEIDPNAIPEVNFAGQNIVGGVTILALALLIYQLFRATKKNVSFFKMADVNLLFTAPVKPENLLIYYMGRSILPSLGGAILFTFYGISQIADKFELSFGNLFFTILGLGFFLFMIQPIRFLVYTLHTRFGVMEYIKNGVIVLAILLSAMILIPGLMADKFWQGMFSWIGSPWFDFFPIVGWSRGIMSFWVHSNWILSSAFVVLYGLSYFVVLKLVIQFSGYYYEDVLEATKSNEEKLEKVRGKKEQSEANFSLNSKKKLALPDFGPGAKAFYWRNYIHASRQDFHPLFGVYSLILAGLGILFAILSLFDWFSHIVIYVYLIILILIYFLAGTGRANIGDLKKPFFYLVPASWSSKFWNMIKLDLVQILLFCTVLIVPTVFIAGLDWLVIPSFLIGILAFYLTGLGINLIPQIGLDEGWDRILIKPLMIGGILLFGLVPAGVASIIAFVISKQFVWALLTLSVGMTFIALILIHVTLDILKRLEFKEI